MTVSERGLARIQVAAMLRRMRVDATVSREQAAAALFCTPAKIGDLERGRSMVKPLDLERLLDLYGVAGAERDELETVVRGVRRRRSGDDLNPARRNQRYVDLESQARSLVYFSSAYPPGFTQTDAYVRAILADGERVYTEQEVADRISVRVGRRATLLRADPAPPRAWCIVGEAALRANVGGPAVMAAQLDTLLEWSTRYSHIGLQVLPLDAGAHPMMGFLITLLRFEPPAGAVLVRETWSQTVYSQDQDEIDRAERAFDLLKARALDLGPSRELLRDVAREYREKCGRAPLERVVHPAPQRRRAELRGDAPNP